MTDHAHHGHHHGPPGGYDPEPAGALDPANQSLADALRKSFAVLKAIMLVMIAAYVLSGWFRVQPGEVGFVVRMGRVVGAGADAVLSPGWHWSFPYPIDQVVTVATQRERLLPVSFMFHVTEQDRLQGIRRVTYAPLSPLRDNYLVTGDVNILHAQMAARYRIVDPVAYITHIHDPTPGDENPPEYEALGDIVSQAAIRVAAGLGVNDIYGPGRRDYLNRVAERARDHLAALAAAGRPLGIEIVAVIAAQHEGGGEAILPPRQVQEEFDKVLDAEQKKSKAISEAQGKARELLNRTAGPAYERLAATIDEEFEALLALLAVGAAEPAAAEQRLDRCRAATDALLLAASGDVRRLIDEARSDADRVVNEARADYERLTRLIPEYERDGEFLLSRLRTEMLQDVLTDEQIVKLFVSDTGKEIWLMIPRDPEESVPRIDEKKPSGQGYRESGIQRIRPSKQ